MDRDRRKVAAQLRTQLNKGKSVVDKQKAT